MTRTDFAFLTILLVLGIGVDVNLCSVAIDLYLSNPA